MFPRKAYEARKVKLDAKETNIPDMSEGLDNLTSAVETAISTLGKEHKFVEEARKWQVRLHSQLRQLEMMKSALSS